MKIPYNLEETSDQIDTMKIDKVPNNGSRSISNLLKKLTGRIASNSSNNYQINADDKNRNNDQVS